MSSRTGRRPRTRSRLALAQTAAALTLLCGPLRADQTLFRHQAWTITAPDAIDCGKPPVLTARGPGNLLDDSNRPALEAVTAGISPALARLCPNLREAIVASGRTRRLVTLPTSTQLPAPPARVNPPAAQPTAPPPAQPSAAPVVAPYQNRRLPALDSARGIEDKCELLLKWTGRMEEEYPERTRNRSLRQDRELYLYRDEDFVQVFGKPYDQTTPKWRAEIYDKVISRCQGLGRKAVAIYTNQFAPLENLLTGPFLGQGRYSPEAAAAAVAKGREARSWMTQTLGQLSSLPITEASYRDLAQYAPSSSGRQSRQPSTAAPLQPLWPSEQKYFTDAVARQRTHWASHLSRQWLAALDSYGPTLEEAQRLVQQRAQQNDIFAAADAPLLAEVNQRSDARLDAILTPLVRARLDELSAIPGTLAGVRQSLAWASSFTSAFQAHQNRPPVAAWRQAYAAQRDRILTAALPEWKQALALNNPSDADLQQLSARVQAFFSSDEPGAMRAAYEQPLAALKETKQRADLAAAARQCDTLAAHPKDPEAAAAGVPDEKLNVESAIPACELAVRQSGAAPRLYFQLGRAYLAAGREEDAVEQLLTAGQEGHGAALAYLAEIHLEGAAGLDPDAELAYSLYERAAEAGFTPAKTILAEFEDVGADVAAAEAEEAALMAELKKTNPELFTEAAALPERKPVDPESINFKPFFGPVFAEATYRGELIPAFDQLKKQRPRAFFDERDQILEYFDTAFVFLGKQGDIDPACPEFLEPDVYKTLRSAINMASDERRWRKENPAPARAPGDLTDAVTNLMDFFGMSDEVYYSQIRTARQAGEFDMGTLVYEYGGCADVPVTRFYNHAKNFIVKTAAEMRRR